MRITVIILLLFFCNAKNNDTFYLKYESHISWGDKLFYVFNKKNEFSFMTMDKKLLFNFYIQKEQRTGYSFFHPDRYNSLLYNSFKKSKYKVVQWENQWGVIEQNGDVIVNNLYDNVWGFLNKKEGILKKGNNFYIFKKEKKQLITDKMIKEDSRYVIFKGKNNYMLDVFGDVIVKNIPNELLEKNKIIYRDFLGNKVSYDNNGVVDNRTYGETHQLTSSSAGQDYTYDKRGNQTGSTSNNSSSDESQEQNTVSVWDIDGHLSEVKENNLIKASYTYDALGRRIRKTLYDNKGNVSKKRLYIRSGQRVLEEYKSDGESTSIDKRYVYGAYVDEVIYAIHGANQEMYYHSDRQYNIRSLSDWKGRALEYYDYTPYGERVINTRWHGKNRSTSAYGNTIGFTGRHLDNETDLYYFRARYYDTEQGRFISRDPAGYVDGMGLYNGYFAWGFMMDPSGKTTCTLMPLNDFRVNSWELVGSSLFDTGASCRCTYRQFRVRDLGCTYIDSNGCEQEMLDTQLQSRTGSASFNQPSSSGMTVCNCGSSPFSGFGIVTSAWSDV